MQTIYIDVLLCVNLVINYLLLSAVSFYTHAQISIKRLLLGSAVGALCSLVMLLTVIPFALNMLIKTVVGGLTVFSAFGKKIAGVYKALCCIFNCNVFLLRNINCSMVFIHSEKSFDKNSVIYLNISPVMLIIYSVICYCAFRLINTIAGKHRAKDTFCVLTIVNGSNALRVNAKIDTGNTLVEPFSQSPVIVIGRNTAKCITPVEVYEYETVTTLNYRTSINSVRFVPFTAVDGGILCRASRRKKSISTITHVTK